MKKLFYARFLGRKGIAIKAYNYERLVIALSKKEALRKLEKEFKTFEGSVTHFKNVHTHIPVNKIEMLYSILINTTSITDEELSEIICKEVY